MQLCRTAGLGKRVRVSPDLLAVLAHSLELSKKSDGAFDVTVGPVVKLWRKARRMKKFPAPDELARPQADQFRRDRGQRRLVHGLSEAREPLRELAAGLGAEEVEARFHDLFLPRGLA